MISQGLTALAAWEQSYAKRYPRLIKGIRFVLSGGIATFLNLALVFVLTEWAGIWYLASAAIAFCTAVMTSFFLQKFWTFEDRAHDTMSLQAGVFLTAAVVNLALNILVVYVLVEYIGVWYLAAQLIAGVGIAVENFFLYKLFIFRRA